MAVRGAARRLLLAAALLTSALGVQRQARARHRRLRAIELGSHYANTMVLTRRALCKCVAHGSPASAAPEPRKKSEPRLCTWKLDDDVLDEYGTHCGRQRLDRHYAAGCRRAEPEGPRPIYRLCGAVEGH